ncbi:calmodulin-lysine N-methyltransferase [Schistocerca americana]|uniref:calmodulin-lysine N-methyltransferase n=1 Tax=Schistocerca americana TaxID=7009 RepID=UPI001F4FF6C9|nr:calmodulin-lysine N-methyltransferase [Schistocerca americana]XP_047119125.1 calmodulin-lysine N-methyltransferase [Schistocerca piceifrons]XP_049764301.1 calmodulin-lysine N-methyltransferase [Schistocerca cancellata]
MSAVLSNTCQQTKESSKRNEIARRRWKILARALQRSSEGETNEDEDVSVRRFTSFHLFTMKLLPSYNNSTSSVASWSEYSVVVAREKYSIFIRHPFPNFTATELMGFNNTGNICIWPSEEVLAFYALCNLQQFAGKTILELGGGSTCLAGLFLAKYSSAFKIHLTDGNESAMKNVQYIVDRNFPQGNDRLVCSVLEWGSFWRLAVNQHIKPYDIILSADCLFFDEARNDLVETIWTVLSENGTAFVMAPQRGDTFDKFRQEAKARGFICSSKKHYSDHVWNRHLQVKQNCDYDENIHYPLLLILKKSMPAEIGDQFNL